MSPLPAPHSSTGGEVVEKARNSQRQHHHPSSSVCAQIFFWLRTWRLAVASFRVQSSPEWRMVTSPARQKRRFPSTATD